MTFSLENKHKNYNKIGRIGRIGSRISSHLVKNILYILQILLFSPKPKHVL